jgi:pimeloyl-ACP methyl ester carboxylesterase
VASAWSDPAPHKNDSLLANGIYINYLDWGGDGAPLILLHGMGDNAHIFDDLVPALGRGFRVIAYSRRGHGRSGKAGPYSTATFVEDLRQFLDRLGLTKVSLAAWSHSGSEMSLMAETHADRVHKIVYLESAYDWGEPALAPIFGRFPLPFNPSGESLSSFDAFQAWQLRSFFPAVAPPSRLEAFFRDQVDAAPGGASAMATDSIRPQSIRLATGGTTPGSRRRRL